MSENQSAAEDRSSDKQHDAGEQSEHPKGPAS
jgi:hypothetical protein